MGDFLRLYLQAYPNAVVRLINPGLCQVETDGAFNSDSFNPRGCLTLSSILNVLDVNGGMSYWRQTGPQFLDIGKLGYLVFMGSLRLTCEPELYDCNIAKQPVKLDNHLVHVGNTSVKTRVSLYLPQVNKPVAQREVKAVFVDKDTRRPVSPPAWWKEKHCPYSQPKEGHALVPLFDFNAYTGRLQQDEFYVQTIDLDSNGHCNHASYARFCYEAYARAQMRQFENTSHPADALRNVKSLTCTFKGEAKHGDLLTVHFVRDPAVKDTYHFQIGKDLKSIIFECCLTFFPQIVSKY